MKTKQTRLTRQKKAISQVLEKSGGHLTAEDVYKSVRRKIKNISLATVYRNLEQLAEKRLIDVVYIAGYPKWYEQKKYSSHGHLFCRNCGKLHDVVDCQLCFTKNKFAKEMKFQAEEFEFVVVGMCQDCARR